MSSNKLVFALCALSLFLVSASIPLKNSSAAAKTALYPLNRARGPRRLTVKRRKHASQPSGDKNCRHREKNYGSRRGERRRPAGDKGSKQRATRITPVFHNQYFHAQVTLSPGVNKIEVRWREGAGGPASGDWNVKAITIFRYSQAEGAPGGEYPPYLFHTSEKEKQCKQCHRMRLTHEEIDTGTDKTCLACHADLLSNVHVHGPVGVGMCAACHDPESRPNRYRIGKDDNVLCYSCHDDRKETDEKHKLMHGPVGAGMCTVCHDPHGSPFEYQLVKAKTEICLMCHQDDANQWLDRPSLHPPFERGDCYKCHDPHSSDYKYNLKADEKDLCKLCHTIPVPDHWHDNRSIAPLFSLPDDLPLDGQGKIMCLTCHDPHGAEGAHLTRRAGCRSCHAI